MAIISTLLFQINIFERYSRSKIKNDTNILLRFRNWCWTININDDINYCSTILHVKVIRTKYAEVNILKKEVAIKLNIQLASSLNLIWRSVVSLAFLVRCRSSFVFTNFPLFLNLWQALLLVKQKYIKLYNCYRFTLNGCRFYVYNQNSTSPEMSK